MHVRAGGNLREALEEGLQDESLKRKNCLSLSLSFPDLNIASVLGTYLLGVRSLYRFFLLLLLLED